MSNPNRADIKAAAQRGQINRETTADTLTDEQIRDARDQEPEVISSECAADALGLPRGPYEYEYQTGDVERARARIAAVINARREGSK